MKAIKLRKNERTSLERVARSQSGQAALARRARVILMSADGVGFNEIRQRVDGDVRFIQHWRKRFTTDRIAGLSTQPRERPTKKVNARLEAEGLRYSVAGQYSCNAGRAPDRDSKRQGAHILKWATQRKPGPFRIVDPIPLSLELSLELSPVQREVLDMIIQDQVSIQGSADPERVILLWSEGASESTTAEKLSISEAEIKTLRKRWWASTARIATAEKKSHKAFIDLVSLIFRIPNEEAPSETVVNSSTGGVQVDHANQEKPAEHKELRAATRAVIEILHHQPKVYGINRSNWTLRSLAKAFEKHYELRVSHTTVGRLLKEAGLSWKKSRRLQSLKVDEDLFFIDELGPLQVKRYGGRSYTPKGATPTHPQNQRSKGSITLYGALSATTNQVTWFYGKSKDSAGIIDLAEMLFNQYHAKSKIYLTWDAASWHGSDELVQWTDKLNEWNKTSEAGPIIEFVPLPSSAQFLDVIEAVFSGMKRAVIHSSDYQSEEEMKNAISTHFRERNEFFKRNPKRAGKKIWEVDFFQDHNHIRSGNYREW